MDIKIELPDLKYKGSFLKAVQEFRILKNRRPEDEHMDSYALSMSDEQFMNDVVEPLQNAVKGIGLPDGYVPATEYWLIDKDGYVGWINLRHELNEYLKRTYGHIGYCIIPSKRGRGYAKQAMEQLMPKAAQIGIEEVLLACDEDNIGSHKVILNTLNTFGGRKIASVREGEKEIFKYWINTRQRG